MTDHGGQHRTERRSDYCGDWVNDLADDDAQEPEFAASAPEGGHQLGRQVAHLERRVAEALEDLAAASGRLADNTGRFVPAWRRVTAGEPRLPVTVAIVVMIALQLLLPEHLTLTATWVLPVVEALLAMMLQSTVSLTTGALVIARAVNILR